VPGLGLPDSTGRPSTPSLITLLSNRCARRLQGCTLHVIQRVPLPTSQERLDQASALVCRAEETLADGARLVPVEAVRSPRTADNLTGYAGEDLG
jgi:hypothetical protein